MTTTTERGKEIDESRLAKALRLAARSGDPAGSLGEAWLLAVGNVTTARLEQAMAAEASDPLEMPITEIADPLTQAEDRQMVERVRETLSLLSEPHRQVLERIHAIQDDDAETKKDIARDLGHSETRMRNLELSAIRWMKQPAVARRLRSHIDHGFVRRQAYHPSDEACWAAWRMKVEDIAGHGANPAWAWRGCPVIAAALRTGVTVDDLARLRTAPTRDTGLGAVRRLEVGDHALDVLLWPGVAVVESARVGAAIYRIAGTKRRAGGGDIDIDAAITLPRLPRTVAIATIGRSLHELADHPLIGPGHRVVAMRAGKAVLRSATRAVAPAPAGFEPNQPWTDGDDEREYHDGRWTTKSQRRRRTVLGG